MAGSVFSTSTNGPVLAAAMDFIETAGASTYTATLVIPAGGVVQNVYIINRVLWTAGGSTAVLNVRNTATPNAYVNNAALHTTGNIALNVLDAWTHFGSPALSATYAQVSYPSGTTITATVTTTGAGGTTGSTTVIVIYDVPLVSVAVKA